MSYAPDYDPSNSFADDESNNASGRSTVKTDELDAQLANISTSINALNGNLQKIQRDDDKLRDFVIEAYALSESLRAMLVTAGKNIRGEWQANTTYAVGDLVQRNGVALICQTPHNSGPSFNLGFWIAISGDGQAQAWAIEALDSQTAAEAAAGTATAQAAAAVVSAAAALASQIAAAASALAAQNAADSIAGLSPVNLTAYMQTFLTAASALQARTNMGVPATTDLANTGNVALGDAMLGVRVTSAGSVARTAHGRAEDRRTIWDFDDSLKAGGTIDATNAVTKAITAAMEHGTGVLAGSGYMDIVIPYRKEGCLLRLDSQVVIPGECLVRFVGEGGFYFQSGFLQGFAGDMFTCTSGNFVAQFHNIRFQGQKALYPGNFAALRTTQDAVHAAFTGCLFRDWGGVALELANCFDVLVDNVLFSYNKGGGMRNTGGASNRFGKICTQVNDGFGLYLAGGGNTGGPFFLEGDLVDNNPAGANLSNRALRITGADSVYTAGTLITSALNNKTPVEFAANAERSGWLGVSAAGKGTATNWVTLGAGAAYVKLGGGLQTAVTGDATAGLTCTGDLRGAYQVMASGEVLFPTGAAASGGAKGTRVGFDTVNDRGFVRSTEPGVSQKALDLVGSSIVVRGPLGSDQTAIAATLGTVVRRLAITNEAGGVLGYIPIYNTIT